MLTDTEKKEIHSIIKEQLGKLTVAIGLHTEREFRKYIEVWIKDELVKTLKEMGYDQPGVGGNTERQPVTHHHIPISEGFSQGGSGQPRSDWGHGYIGGGGGIYPGSCEGEHHILDGGAPRKEINAQSSFLEKFGSAFQRAILGTDLTIHDEIEGAITPDMMYQITMPIDAWAAIILEHMHEGFATSDRGQAAQGAHDYIRRCLNDVLPGWMETTWPSKRK